MIRLGRQPLTILMRLGETQMFPMPKVNVLQTAFIMCFLLWTFSAQTSKEKKCLSFGKCYITPHLIMKTICPQRSLLTVPKVVFVEKFYRNQMFLIDIYSFNPIQIPVDFSLKI